MLGAVLVMLAVALPLAALAVGGAALVLRALVWVWHWPQRRRARRAALRADLEWQDAAYIAGDPRGTYGRFIPMGPPQ